MQRGKVGFQLAGENIAAQHSDGVAALQGWLNSEGHRKNLLNEQFTGLEYTISFIHKILFENKMKL